MQSRDKIAYLGALSLLMSLAELFVPRPLPFFRLGLANIPLLLGLTMDVGPYMALCGEHEIAVCFYTLHQKIDMFLVHTTTPYIFLL